MIRAWWESFRTHLQLDKYITPDCRGGVCAGCEICACNCHKANA